MRGIVRPCRKHLGPELHARWQAHLCGLCLTLRDVAGQPERALTGYDVLLLSVLVEAQAGAVATSEAAPCPLRGFTRATVVASSSSAGRLAAAGALLSAGAGLADKLEDGDLPRPVRGPARRAASRVSRTGTTLAAEVGLDPEPVLSAPAAAALAEATPEAGLRALLASTGEAVASLFRHTATVAGRPGNASALADCGRAFGQLVHLLDAVEDLAADAAAGHFNPLTATGTDEAGARAVADQLAAEVAAAYARVEVADGALAEVLLGREVRAAVERVLPTPVEIPAQRGGTTAGLAVWALMLNAVFVGGSWGSGGRGGCCSSGGGYGRPGYGYQQRGYRRGYAPPAYGYRRVGPGCGQLLACNCCANLACNACCCGANDC
ncbi:MAG: DUF5685 family protein [Actinobacteria bacterium]|nr:DUF5685 family protein [Actinomycetota bacterium]